VILFKMENLVLPPSLRPYGPEAGQVEYPTIGGAEAIGTVIEQICSWFQVSGVRKYLMLNTDLAASEDQHRRKRVNFMSDSTTAGQIRFLTPDTRNLNTAGKRSCSYYWIENEPWDYDPGSLPHS